MCAIEARASIIHLNFCLEFTLLSYSYGCSASCVFYLLLWIFAGFFFSHAQYNIVFILYLYEYFYLYYRYFFIFFSYLVCVFMNYNSDKYI